MTAPRTTTSLDRVLPSWRTIDDQDPVGPMWCAVQIFRLATFVYALGFQIAINHDLDRPALTWCLFAVLTAANVWWAVGYLVGFGRKPWFVAVELVVSIAMMLSTEFVADRDWIAGNQTWPTTLWCTNAVLSSALLGGAVWGMTAGLAVGLTNFYVKGHLILNFGRNATFILLIAVGMAVGLGATRARFTHRRLAAAIGVAARAAERERLSREVHDGVLQVLALIARRGGEIGGDTAELAGLAAEQEARLRRLIAAAPELDDPQTPRATADLAVALRALDVDRLSISTPVDPVLLPAATVDELLAATANILDNTARHAGPGAHSFLLLEDLGDEVVLSARDDGVGIAPGRLREAVADGRMGIARSIIGRVEDLGGRARLESAPGAGTEWELTIPVAEADRIERPRPGDRR